MKTIITFEVPINIVPVLGGALYLHRARKMVFVVKDSRRGNSISIKNIPKPKILTGKPEFFAQPVCLRDFYQGGI